MLHCTNLIQYAKPVCYQLNSQTNQYFKVSTNYCLLTVMEISSIPRNKEKTVPFAARKNLQRLKHIYSGTCACSQRVMKHLPLKEQLI